jgi:GntR family transcriptional repressor for pyruvate dehydrogenase complex
MIKPLVRKTLHEEIINQIMDGILAGLLNPGERIDGEAELARQFNVSRNIVREALKSLELIDVVHTINGKGTFISDGAKSGIELMHLMKMMKSDDYAIDLMESRIMIEGDIAYLAAIRATPKDIEELAVIEKETKEWIEKGAYRVDNGLKFHMKVADCSKNQIMKRFLRSISNELTAQRGQLILAHKSNEELILELKEHVSMIKFIKEKKPKETKKIMQMHIMRAMRILKENKE